MAIRYPAKRESHRSDILLNTEVADQISYISDIYTKILTVAEFLL